MARTKPSLPRRSSSPPGVKPPPREDPREEDRPANSSQDRSDGPARRGASSMIRSGMLSCSQAPGKTSASDVTQECSLKTPSASRGDQKPRARESRYRSNRHGHRGGRYASGKQNSRRYYDLGRNSQNEDRSTSFRQRSERRGQDYHRGRDDRSWNDERNGGSSWGRERGPPQRDHNGYDSRDHGGRYESSYPGNYYSHDHSRNNDQPKYYGHTRGRDRYHDSDPPRYSAPTQDDHQGQFARRHQDDSAPIPKGDESDHQPHNSSSAPSLKPSQGGLSSTEKLREDLEREELETKIALQRLETERIKKQLGKIKNGNPVQSESIAARNKVTQKSTTRNSPTSDDDSENEFQPTRKSLNRGAKRTSDDDSDDEVLPIRNPLNKKGTKRRIDDDSDDEAQARRNFSDDEDTSGTSKAHKTSRKKNTNRRRRRGGRGKLASSTKRQLSEAQKANDEKMKFRLLKEYEEDLAAKKAKKMHHYTEKDLMSSFKPVILDHHLIAGDGKFLVKWVKKGESSENHCLSWISHEDFLFPVRAHKYLSGKINDNTCSDEIEGLKSWVRDCEEREQCLNCLSTFDDDENEFDSQQEIDFCCFLCKCPWSHPLKHTIRSCEFGLKYHRGCCHGYNKLTDFCSFVSPVGKVVKQQYGDDSEEEATNGGSENEVPDNTVTPDENLGNSQRPNPVTIINGQCEKYLQCLQSRSAMVGSKRDAVVLCINAGVGSAAISLKNLGIKVGTIIHAEADRLAQHVIRSNHDYNYGEIDHNDGIDHIVGLYESLADLKEPDKLVSKYGPIDLIICTSPHGTTREGNQHAFDFFELVKSIEKLNVEIHHFDHLLYLLESSPCIKDHLPRKDISYCVCEHEKLFLCNWPISSHQERSPPSGTEEDALGLPKGYVVRSVNNVFSSIQRSLCVGLDDSNWRDEMHPKLWSFMSMGPTGYDVKHNQGVFGPEAFSLRITNPSNLEALSDVNYSNHLLGRSSSVQSLDMLLNPITELFGKKDYGPQYKISAPKQEQNMSESEDGSVTQEHGGTTPPPNSSSNDVAFNADAAPAVKTEVKDEGSSTDDEAILFAQVESSLLAG